LVVLDVRVTATDGTLPNGRVTLSVGTATTTFDVNNGRGTASLLTAPGTYAVHASFVSFGPWGSSNADTQITVVPGSPAKKRAVRH